MGIDIPEINNHNIPVLLMCGAKDIWIPPAMLDLWKADLPKASYIVYDDAGHVPMEEIPERTVEDAMVFMSANRSAGSITQRD